MRQDFAASQIETRGSYAVADVDDRQGLESAIAGAGQTVSGIAYAVGSITLKPAARVTDADVECDFRLNTLGAFRAVQLALPALKANPGISSMVLFSSVVVSQDFTSHASIAMAKGAVEGLSLALAAELAPKVRVNCVAPSLTNTPLAAGLTANAQMASAIAVLHPMQRLGEANDVTALAAFLLGPDSGWIAGQVVGVDGGRSSLRAKG